MKNIVSKATKQLLYLTIFAFSAALLPTSLQAAYNTIVVAKKESQNARQKQRFEDATREQLIMVIQKQTPASQVKINEDLNAQGVE